MFAIGWLATGALTAAGMMQLVTAAWMMTELTNSRSMISLAQASLTLPIFVLALGVGVVVDSYSRRKMMIFACALTCVACSAQAFLTSLEFMTPWRLLLLSLAVGAGAAIHFPAWQTSASVLFGRERLSAAVAANSLGYNLVRSLAPAVGGLLTAAAGASISLSVATALSLVALTLFVNIEIPETKLPQPSEPILSAVGGGLRFVTMSCGLHRIFLQSAIFGMAGISLQALLPIIVNETLHEGAGIYGTLLMCFGVGSAVGAVFSAAIRQRIVYSNLIALSFVALLTSALVVSVSESPLPIAISLFISGGAWILGLSTFNVTTQLLCPNWVLGRVISVFFMAVFGGSALGSWIWGLVADASDIQVSIISSSGLLVVGALIAFFAPIPHQPDGSGLR